MTSLDNRRSPTLLPSLLLAAGALTISFAAILAKLAVAHQVADSTAGAWRFLLASAFFFLSLIVRRRSVRLPRQATTFALLAGAFFAIDIYVWHKSIIIVGAGMATILANTQVFWTAGIGRLVFAEKLPSLFLIAAPLGFLGVVLLTGVGSEIAFTRRYGRGLALGLGTGVAYACYITTLKRSAKRDDPRSSAPVDVRMAWLTLTSGLLIFTGAAVERVPLAPQSLTGAAIVLLLALGPQILGWLLIDRALSRLPATRAALLLLLQPTFATIWGALIFKEVLGATQILGAGLTLIAIFMGSLGRGEASVEDPRAAKR